MSDHDEPRSPRPNLKLTPLGRRLAGLPLHPRIGRLLLAGADAGLPREAATLAALLSEKDIIAATRQSRRRAATWEGDSDLLDRLDLFEHGHASAELDIQAVRAVERVRDELLRLVGRDAAPRCPAPHSPAERHRALLKLLLHAYPDRVTVRREGDPSRGVMVGNRGVVLEPSSVVRRAPLFLSIDPRDAGGLNPGATPGRPYSANAHGANADESRVSLASAIELDWLAEIHPSLTTRRITHRYDPARGKVLSLGQTVFAGLVVSEAPVGAQADRAGAELALFDALAADAPAVFAADEDAAQWLTRIHFLRRHMPELGLPALNDEELRAVLREACASCTSLDQVRAGHRLRQLLENTLSWHQRTALGEHAPEALVVPSGSRIRLQYPTDETPPVLAVSLQEVFGLAETPRLAAGRAPVVMHLLAPNHRPVQVTSDLRSFWNTTYAEVRRDLRARYPKHPWPEDPWNAPAVSVGRRRRP